MKSLFDADTRASIVARIERLAPDATRQWGKLDPAQALAHCAAALAAATSDTPGKQKLLGKLLMPFIRKAVLGDKPFARNGPTDASFVITDARQLDSERQRLLGLIDEFCAAGPDEVQRRTHIFFGRLSGDEWGRLQFKHIDHHLRQFDA